MLKVTLNIPLNRWLRFSNCQGIRIFNDKAFFFPMAQKHDGQFFNFRIFIKLFIHEVKKTLKFWFLELYLFNKYQ